jgi:hypothetical protein
MHKRRRRRRGLLRSNFYKNVKKTQKVYTPFPKLHKWGWGLNRALPPITSEFSKKHVNKTSIEHIVYPCYYFVKKKKMKLAPKHIAKNLSRPLNVEPCTLVNNRYKRKEKE